MFTVSRTPWTSLVIPVTVAVVLVIGVCTALYLREADQISSTNLGNEGRRMEIFNGLFSHEMDSTVSDLRLLASGDGIQDYLSSNKPTDLDRAAHRAIFFSKDNPDYDQVRFIDQTGQEILRVNRGGVLVPRDQLQNKADRPYFQKAFALNPGQVYVSAIDLNVEHGIIERPLKPMIRMAIPVFDVAGQKRGVYIINYLAANSFDRLRNFVTRYTQRFRMLNGQGYWLVAQKPEMEWGFMLPGRADQTLAKTHPDLWAKIMKDPTGQEPFEGGFFTWSRVQPKDFSDGKPVTLVTDDDFLVFASQITPEEWAGYFVRLRQTFVIVAALLLLFAIAISWFIQARRQANLERDRFFSLTRDLLCVANFSGYFTRVNPAWEKAFGYTPDELKAKPFLDFVHPDDRQKTVEQTVGLSMGTEVLSFENRYRCKDGSYRWLLWSARALVDEKLIYASARDLTDRKVIEEKLQLSEMRARSIIESAYDGFISLDVEGRITDWNLKAETIFGWKRDEALGRYLHDTIIPPSYRDAHVQGLKHLRATGEGPVLNKTLELAGLRRSGEEFPIELVIWPLQMGSETTYHAFVRDITTRKVAAESIAKLNAELQERAGLLEIANKELESFSYSVSHDLRAPLRHIHGFVELLQKSPALQTDNSAQRYMGVIAKAAKEMGLLIDDLLAFSRTGRAEMHPVKIDMHGMVAQVIRDLEMDTAGRVVKWDLKSMSAAMGDPALIRLVWVNLLVNAVKYTRPREEAKIEVGEDTNEANKAGRKEVVYYVRDNGVGFDMQYAAKLFGVFQRLHRSEDFEGTGIGLANVQRIIHRHGGRAWADSKVDVGSTFYFSLPVNVQSK